MNQERRNEIVRLVNLRGFLSNDEMTARFNVSIETVRRDLAFLQKAGAIERVYGGAAKKQLFNTEPSYSSREQENAEVKRAIAAGATELVPNGAAVFFDLGTTVLALAALIKRDSKITAFTTALRTAAALAENGLKVVLPGGEIRGGELSLYGALTSENLDRFNFDVAFIGAGGVTAAGITDYVVDEAGIRAKVINNARKVVVLADHSKFGVRAVCNVCPLSSLYALVTDSETPKAVLKEIEKAGVKIIIV